MTMTLISLATTLSLLASHVQLPASQLRSRARHRAASRDPSPSLACCGGVLIIKQAYGHASTALDSAGTGPRLPMSDYEQQCPLLCGVGGGTSSGGLAAKNPAGCKRK